MSVTAPTVKVLWTRALNVCAFPTCTQLLTVDAVNATTGEGFVTIVGEQAHIRSRRVGGPRYDPKYDASLLDSYENLILLCPTHHTMIDSNAGDGYTAEALVAMRAKHERRQQRRERLEKAIRAYVGQQYNQDDRVLFEQVDLHGPSVDSMFVDVPFACRPELAIAGVLQSIAEAHPPERESLEALDAGDQLVVAGLARLARSLSGLARVADQIAERGAQLVIAGERFSSFTPARLLHLLARLQVDLVDWSLEDAEWVHQQRHDERHPHRRVDAVQSVWLRELLDAGLSRDELGEHFGVSRATLFRAAAL